MYSSICMDLGYFLRTSEKDLGGETIASVCITGVAVVFIALVILIALVSLYGKIFDVINGNKAAKAEAEKKAKEEKAAAEIKKVEKTEPEPQLTVQDGIEEEVVAVITAAISAYAGQTGRKLAVRNIRLSGAGNSGGRNAWSAAALSESTRPF